MPSFKVIRASAGSGKTFNLTREFLHLLFTRQDAFMHILAVTFTNKATEEMKSRIVLELYALSSDKPSRQLSGLIQSTGFTEKQIRSKALVILKKLLHQYSRFSVNTIDAFFQRIIRSFTRDLGIQEGYSIELDTDLVLNEIIDRLLIQAENDRSLLSWLTRFAESLIEKGESWNLKKGIRELGGEIFKEEFKSLGETSIALFSDRNFLIQYRDMLFGVIRHAEKTYSELGKRGIAIIASHGLHIEDFSMKNRGPAGFIKRIADGSFAAPNQTAIHASESVEKWYTSTSLFKDIIKETARNELMPLMHQIIDFHSNQSRDYHTASVIIKNLYTLGILIDLSNLSDTWCSENNVFLLPEAPVFLNKIIDGNDTPFIYEKAGCWYHHFMIDEFQDTSAMQWLNFKPLISNSLSQDFNNLAVGDVKQSIYRWRNSNWEILENRIHSDFLPGIINTVTLTENWRSLSNIISFNNSFFKSAAIKLQEEFTALLNNSGDLTIDHLTPITELYENMEQTSGKKEKNEGYVHLEYLSDDDEASYCDTVNHKVVCTIFELLQSGYHLNDIAILTRKKSEAAQLADYLIKYREADKPRIDVISDEALKLESSVVVNTLVALLEFITDPLSKTNTFYISSVNSNYLIPGDVGTKWALPLKNEKGSALYELPEEFLKLAHSVKSISLIELTEQIITLFNLEDFTGELVYLMAFRDLMIEYSGFHGSDILRFLEFWSETGKNRSIAAPAGQDAVRILTLHKSKGLEFKITIIPFCTWELNSFNKSFLWCAPSAEPFNQLPVIPLNFTTKLKETIFAEDYFREIHKQYIDNLNLLYVAFTRAREVMFIFCKAREGEKLTTVSDLARQVMGPVNLKQGSLSKVSPEEPEPGKTERTLAFKTGKRGSIAGRVRIAFQGNLMIDPAINKPSRPLNEGKILHEIFTSIHTREDIEPAMERLQIQGKIAANEKDKYYRLISYAMNDLQVSTWFTKEWSVMNESEIILPGGAVKRPDRIMMREGQTIVIDYKFGSKIESDYESQIGEYAQTIREMGYQNIDAFLWYVKLGKVIQVRF